ncbi:MAG: ZIP family metal transporter [Clostridia bacterium]|nr:ZIP family metal transporter [Clostridia bacterium]
MTVVLLTALGVGGATLVGAILGFLFKKISHKFSDIVLSFAAGIMLAAAMIGLILPALDYGGKYGIITVSAGVIVGAVVLDLIDKLVPHLHKLMGSEPDLHNDGDAAARAKANKVLLFVLAIAIHNLPEGIAAGVGFGTGNNAEAFLIAGGIALQNIPEGMVIIAPMLASGIPPRRTFLYAALTGVVEVVGTFIGYFAVQFSSAILPFALAFAGGTMLYVISDEMIPETHAHGAERGATYSLLLGFLFMLVFDFLLA